jgi:hypothetical protein
MSDHHCPAHDLYTPTCAPCRVLTLTAELAGSDEELRRSQAALATAVREREEARRETGWHRELAATHAAHLSAARRALGKARGLLRRVYDVAGYREIADYFNALAASGAEEAGGNGACKCSVGLPCTCGAAWTAGPAPAPEGACGERLPDPRVDREALVAFAGSVREPTGPLAGAAPAPPPAAGEDAPHDRSRCDNTAACTCPCSMCEYRRAPARDPGGAR